ncbi:MAG: hypothetical protein IKT38_07150 [Clostridia bacterium]|nr:hypothetical protein [Clostridia bacterium]
MQSEIFPARIIDTLDICEKTNKPKFLGFLSAEEAVYAEKILENRKASYSFFGGYDEAERVLLGCFPEYITEQKFPITAITFSFRKEYSLTHRDFLGSLMALGIGRETVGDILVEPERAVAFVSDDITDYILNEVKKIGRVGVLVSIGASLPLPQKSSLAEFSCTVASGRLDCVVALLCNISRNEASQKIEFGLVSVNSVQTEKTTKQISSGDIITVRGKGKFIIESLCDKTRKNRIILKYKKYI